MTAYYNEHDPQMAAWLRELIRDGLIADGEVDERDIREVQPGDIVGFDQCHWFAGIGGWSYALRLAGWPNDRPVWTGSCPCQPFSSAGRGASFTDPRHLWPAWFRLIAECRPPVVCGEQVAAAVGWGWLDLVSDDLEGAGYAVWPVCVPACGVGAPHIRQRLWFVAESDDSGRGARLAGLYAGESDTARSGGSRVADAEHPERRALCEHGEDGRHGQDSGRTEAHGEPRACGEVRSVADRDGERCHGKSVRLQQRGPREAGPEATRRGAVGDVGDSSGPGLQGRHGTDLRGAGRRDEGGSLASAGPWSDLIWLPCRDGKARPTQPGLFPLAHGIPGRVGLLRGAGNAIVPEAASEVVRAYMVTAGQRGDHG